jgi:hypothetical protein
MRSVLVVVSLIFSVLCFFKLLASGEEPMSLPLGNVNLFSLNFDSMRKAELDLLLYVSQVFVFGSGSCLRLRI